MIHSNPIVRRILSDEYGDYPENHWHYDREYRMIEQAYDIGKKLSIPSVSTCLKTELTKRYQEKIDELETEKVRYKDEDDQYSWHISDDEQKQWKDALSILNEY